MYQIDNLYLNQTNDAPGWGNFGINAIILILTIEIVFLNRRNVYLNQQNVNLNRQNVRNNERSAESGKETLEVLKQINNKIN